MMGDDEPHKIAAQSPENVRLRERHELYKNLQRSLLDLRR